MNSECKIIYLTNMIVNVGAGKSHLPVRSVLLLRRGVHRTPAPVPARKCALHVREGTETLPYKVSFSQ